VEQQHQELAQQTAALHNFIRIEVKGYSLFIQG
jgi:hypothetical protein